jgi:tyrosyl-tRNA synthetase
MNAYDTLDDRGFLYQLTDEDIVRDRLNGDPVAFYIGFDPTADSLHVGHLLPIMAARILQRAGHRPIMLVGGGTAMVGDPSGKTDMRQMLTREQIQANADAIKQQLSRFIEFGDSKAIMVDNADWLLGLKYVEFLRDVGCHFSVNRMLAAESVKQRLETGLSFLEFNYSLLQAYDFYVLAREYDCDFQLGGQDQWGNIVAGVDLTRRMISRPVFGATIPLLTDSNGKKIGKTEAGAVWLDPDRTSVFDYYQFWRSTDDADVGKLLMLFSDLPLAEVQCLAGAEDAGINRAKEVLAYEATAMAHGAEAAAAAFTAATNQFGFADPDGKIETTSAITKISGTTASLPTHEVTGADVEAGIWIVKLLADSGLAQSNGDARRKIQGGGCYLNDEKVADVDRNIVAADFSDGEANLRSGKKNVRRIVIT